MNNLSREKVQLICLIIAILVLMIAISGLSMKNEKLEEQLAIVPTPEVITGIYTLIQYTDAGWINPIYITEYYFDGQVLMYLEKGSFNHKPINFAGIRFIDGWVEGDGLMQYGYWIPEEFDL